MKRLKPHIHRFKKWQEEPYPVAPLSEENHICNSCSTEYIGNFCPRCGQSSKITERMSFKKTVLLFLDVWGVGNSGMFHTLRDLIFRPGYLICDYLSGKRSAYFPPFKLLFLLTTLSLLVSSGFNVFQENFTQDYHISTYDLKSGSELITKQVFDVWNYLIDLQDKFPALFRFTLTILTSGFYFLFFRKSKKIGSLSYHEFFIAMVYMVNMANIYSIVFRFFGAPDWLVTIPTFLYFIPLQQMTGYSLLQTGWRFLLCWCMIITTAVLIFFLSLTGLVITS